MVARENEEQQCRGDADTFEPVVDAILCALLDTAKNRRIDILRNATRVDILHMKNKEPAGK